MPTPLSPIGNSKNHLPGIFMPNDEAGFSPLQKMILDIDTDTKKTESQQLIRIKQKKDDVDNRDADLLHQIWLSAEPDAKSIRQGEMRYTVPDNIGDYDVIRLKTAGLVVGRGRDVKFTEKGDKIVKKRILNADSVFDTERTREKYDPDAVMRKTNRAEG